MSGFTALRRFVRPKTQTERCGLCGTALLTDHEHLAEPSKRRLVCACGPCALLFSSQEEGRFRRVPSRVELLTDLHIADDRWGALGVPVRLVFFYRSTAAGGVLAIYPSPAGPLESLVESDAWHSLAEDNPVLKELTPDVDAILVNRVNGANEVFVCSLDRCHHLIGLVRTHWRGFTGGPDLWRAIETYFARLRAEAGA